MPTFQWTGVAPYGLSFSYDTPLKRSCRVDKAGCVNACGNNCSPSFILLYLPTSHRILSQFEAHHSLVCAGLASRDIASMLVRQKTGTRRALYLLIEGD